MSQKLTDTNFHQSPLPTGVTGKTAAAAPPKAASGAGAPAVYPSNAPDGFIGWNPGGDVARSITSPVQQPVNSNTL